VKHRPEGHITGARAGLRSRPYTLGGMPLGVRAIRPEELVEWIEVMHAAFHSNRPAADEAAFRRSAFDQDYSRSLASFDGERLVGTLESFPAELTLPGGTARGVDAISAVSVLPTHRRRGALTRMINQDLRTAKERGDLASILIPSEYAIYGRFGFGPATLRVEYAVDTGLARFTRAAAGTVELVEPSRLLQLAPPIFDRVRKTRPGQIDRSLTVQWESRLGLREPPWGPRDSIVRCAIHLSDSGANAGEVDGYVVYRSEDNRRDARWASRVNVSELMALSSDAYLALWRFCCEMDLVNEVRAAMRSPDEPLPWLLQDPRAAIQETRRGDFLWLRTLDTPGFLSARRYTVAERLVLEISDPLNLAGGRFALESDPTGAACVATDEGADLSMGMTALGAIALGGQSLHVLAEVGLIEEERPGALARAERVFRWPVPPWCSTMF
jgi:predicted acetyltransferase